MTLIQQVAPAFSECHFNILGKRRGQFYSQMFFQVTCLTCLLVETFSQETLLKVEWRQSNVGKKMAAVHFITTPCEPKTAYKTQGKPNFYNICPCTKDIVYRRFEDFITLLYVFMNVVKGFVRSELWVNVPVAIFFPKEDSAGIRTAMNSVIEMKNCFKNVYLLFTLWL